MSTESALFKPLQLGPITIRNRVVMSALTRNRSVPTNIPNEVNLEYYRQRAKGGAGLIVTEGTLISQQGTSWPHAAGIWSKEQTDAWKKIVDAVHAEGAYMYMQLWHLGRLSHPDAPEQIASGLPVYGPSAVAAKGGVRFRHIPGEPGYVTPTAVEDPTILIEQFRKAAINAKEAGLDGVELHGANGYLVSQFLDSGSNTRTDKWGGSIENRARFTLETLKALIEVFGADRVGVKLTPAGGLNDMGMPLQETLDTFSYLITEIDKLKIAYVTLVRYSTIFDPPVDGKIRGTPHDILESYGHLVKTPKLFLNSGLTPEEAEKLVEAGKIDVAVFGIGWVSHPDLANRIKHGKPLDTLPDFMRLYVTDSPALEEQGKGYTDYPFADYD